MRSKIAQRRTYLIMLLPCMIILVGIIIVPLVNLFRYSFYNYKLASPKGMTYIQENTLNPILFLSELQDFINKRHEEMPEGSYTTSLFNGQFCIAQSCGKMLNRLLIVVLKTLISSVL